MTLQISASLALPAEVATETLGILAKKGAGKSNAAVVLAEELHDAGVPWVAVDPKGDWWGVRSSANGKSAGLPVVVFGGKHGDVPLEPTAGALIADLVLGDDDRGYLSCVLDVSQFTISDQRRFLLDFGERLFRRKDEDRVLHLFLEEAHEYLPQSVPRESTRLVSTWQRIVKQGRFKGLGVTLVSQRSAALNKDVLTQADSLLVLRTMSPQDRAAVKGWVEVNATSGDVLQSLPQLAPGEAWLWSPEHFPDPVRFQWRRRRTFDSGATPKIGQARIVPRTLADVDLAAVKDAMAETIEKAKADDPRTLRRRITELEASVDRAYKDGYETGKTHAAEPTEVPVLDEHAIARLEGALAGFEIAADSLAKNVAAEMAEPARLLNVFALQRDQQDSHQEKARLAPGEAIHRGSSAPRQSSQPSRRTDPAGSAAARSRTGEREMRPANPSGSPVSRPQQKILDALAWFEAVGITTPTRGQVAFQARVSPKSSGFEKNCSTLRTAGLIDYPGANRLGLTGDGRSAAEQPERPGTSADLQQAFYEGVSGPQATLLRQLVDLYPRAIDRQNLADLAGVSSASSGFEKNISTLRSLGLIDYPSPGFVVATDLLFLS